MIDDPLNRLKVKRGSAVATAKLSEKLVIQIREERQKALDDVEKTKARHSLAVSIAKNYTASALSKQYGVHIRTVEKMLSGETWSHI